jgi:hexosaminidase
MTRSPRLLIPVRTWEPLPGRFACPATLLVHAPLPADAAAVETLRAELARQGRSLRPADAVRAHLVLRRDPAIGPREAYRLHIARDRVELSAPAAAGAYYGMQTLRELLRLDPRRPALRHASTTPPRSRAAASTTTARAARSRRVATVKALVEQLAHWKLNELQLYIENTFTFAATRQIGQGFSPYTPGRPARDPDALPAAPRPLRASLTSFGHMEKILALRPTAHLGEMPGWRGHPGGIDPLPGRPAQHPARWPISTTSSCRSSRPRTSTPAATSPGNWARAAAGSRARGWAWARSTWTSS